jgi:hypothetical protein
MLTFAPFASFSPVYANTWLGSTDITPTARPKAMAPNFIIQILLYTEELQTPAGARNS